MDRTLAAAIIWAVSLTLLAILATTVFTMLAGAYNQTAAELAAELIR